MGASSSQPSTESAIIDADGYRHNVGIVLINQKGGIFWAKRLQMDAWQFPQGGINENETPEEALGRELLEEVGLTLEDARVIGSTPGWISYDLPERYRRQSDKPYCVGQKQKWFLLKVLCADEKINLAHTQEPEFEAWSWVSYWYPLSQVVQFKEPVYRQVLSIFAPVVFAHVSAGG